MRFMLFFIIGIYSLSCSKEKGTGCTEVALKSISGFPVGTAIDWNEYQNSKDLSTAFHHHFNSLTPENELKFSNLRPVSTGYRWQYSDSLINLAYKDGMRVHGHTLVWYKQLPTWLHTYEGDFSELLTGHIQLVMKRYRGKISSWDVVNEALGEDGLLRKTIWLEKLGGDYIYQAFKVARDSDPDALLFYNDFNLAINPKKLDAAIRLCQNLRQRGIDVSGIGMQMHIGQNFPLRRELADAVEKIWRAGFKVHFSELDVSVNSLGNKMDITESDWEEQREKYYEVVSVYSRIPAKYQHGITLWGIGDADSWLPESFQRIDGGLLFNGSYHPKPAYCGFKNALK